MKSWLVAIFGGLLVSLIVVLSAMAQYHWKPIYALIYGGVIWVAVIAIYAVMYRERPEKK
jgi:sugar phosphate permease